MYIISGDGAADNWRDIPAAQEFLRHNPDATFADYQAHCNQWWEQWKGEMNAPHTVCSLGAPCATCREQLHRAELARLPKEQRRWLRLLYYPVIAKGIGYRHLSMEPAYTAPDQWTPDEWARLLATLCRDEFAHPLMSALAPSAHPYRVHRPKNPGPRKEICQMSEPQFVGDAYCDDSPSDFPTNDWATPKGAAFSGNGQHQTKRDDARGGAPKRSENSRAAEPKSPPEAPAPIEAVDDPHRLARLFIDERYQHRDGRTLLYWREELYRWDGCTWHVVPDKELRAELTASIKAEMDRVNLIAQKRVEQQNKPPPEVRKVTSRLTADVLHALQSMTVLSARNEPPTWIYGNGPFPASEYLACRNGLVHLPSLVAREQHFLSPTPSFFSGNCLDFDFDLYTPKPSAWLSFLDKLWPGDQQSIHTLQEWIGYLLTPNTQQQKILMLLGPMRSGKGTIARVIRGLIGANNVVCPTLSSLSANFGLWQLLGKSVAMIQDARLSGKTDVAAVVERLLSILGEDAQTIARKYLPDVTTKLYCRFILFTNELPKLIDASGALPGRMILLRLTESFYGKEDTTLTDRLLAELPAILLWAIEGWHRMRDRGHFIQPDAGNEMLDELADLASPVGAFVRDCCRIGPGYQVERTTLFNAWKRWCEEHGREHPGDAATFGRNLRAVAPALGNAQPRTSTGERIRVYEGICLK